MSKQEKKKAGGEDSAGELFIDDSAAAGSQPKQEDGSADKWKNDYLYLRAEFDNFRKNTIKERSDMAKYGAERFIRSILSVIDNFDRALGTEVNSANYEKFVEGIRLTASEFKSALSNMGVTIVDPTGQPFDPMVHEALSSEETDTMPPGHVFRVFQNAYKLHDKVVRPAQVVVSKEKPAAPGDSNGVSN